MPFTLIPEDGTGLVDANSYVSVDEVRDYLAIIPSATDLLALTDDVLGQYAAWSTRILDQKVRWCGYRVVWPDGHAQALAWPRTRVVDKDRQCIASDVVPTQVKAATIEFMRYIFETDPTVGNDVDNLKEVDVDVIKVIWQDGVAQTSYPTLINQILEGLGWMQVGSKGWARVVKA